MTPESSIIGLLDVMAQLRSPQGCPWDREQDHLSLRFHAVEEVYELIDAIEAGDDREMTEELGDLLLQVVFHCQLAKEREAFTFSQVCQNITDKLIRRHPHVFGPNKLHDVEAVWTQWEQIKREEKKGTRHERGSAFDGIPKHLPALLQNEKLIKKARKAGLYDPQADNPYVSMDKPAIAEAISKLVASAYSQGWSAEELLRRHLQTQESELRRQEQEKTGATAAEGP